MKVECRGFGKLRKFRERFFWVENRIGYLCVKMQATAGGIFCAPQLRQLVVV